MNWQIKPKAPSAFLKRFPEFSSLIVQLFYNRGLKTQRQVDEFFNPDYQGDLHDPFLLKGMRKAVKRIEKAIKRKEKMLIYGDYDADGVCSAAILYSTLQSLGAKDFQVYIPDRAKEGHGLNKGIIRQSAKKKIDLIITVDCGSSDLEEIDLADSLGIDVVVVDHHRVKDGLSKAKVLVNPWQKGDKYPFKDLAGAGLAYKLSSALLSGKKNPGNYLKKWLLDLVALATVADVMPLLGENRTLVKYGLGVLAQTRRLGLKELMKVARLSPEITNPSLNGEAPLTNLNSRTLGFILGPRLNAAGRMAHASKAFQLLITQNRQEASQLAQEVNQYNLSRQNLTEGVVQQVRKRLDERFSRANPKLIFEGSPDWPIGLIGLVAGKIAEQYHRPAVIYQQRGYVVSASCRGIPQFDLLAMVKQGAEFFDDFGGHAGSAGFRMKKENLDKVKDIFNQLAEDELKEKDLAPGLDIEAELSLRDMNQSNYDQIQQFAPFGRDNPEPRFLIRGAEIDDLRTVGNNGQHLKLELIVFDKDSAAVKSFKAIAFGLADWQTRLKRGDLVDVVFEMILDDWNGRSNLGMKVIDLTKV
jgi:single-stranded-DNA-specific exonuclease